MVAEQPPDLPLQGSMGLRAGGHRHRLPVDQLVWHAGQIPRVPGEELRHGHPGRCVLAKCDHGAILAYRRADDDPRVLSGATVMDINEDKIDQAVLALQYLTLHDHWRLEGLRLGRPRSALREGHDR